MKHAKGPFMSLFVIILAAALSAMSCGDDGPSTPEGNDTIPDGPPGPSDTSMIVDHSRCDISSIPREAIQDAIDALVIAYGHTSHGSQLVTGMDSLAGFLDDELYRHSSDGSDNTLQLRDKAMPNDLGYSSWEPDTRAYLDAHPEVNVVIWSWCGQVADATSGTIDQYLGLMSDLERDYPEVAFVYMTGHLTGDAPGANLFVRNQQ